MAIEIKSVKGYYTLDSWVIGNILQLATERLCARILDKNNDPCGRQYDQMTQAARSITANIAEGCSRHQTSRESEMSLLDVARASSAELHGDIFYQMFRFNIEPWSIDDEAHLRFDSIKLDRPEYGKDWEKKALLHLRTQYAKLQPWLEHNSLEIALNSMLFLCNKETFLLERLIAHKLEAFKEEGGFREGLTQERMKTLNQRSTEEGAPKCPKCDAPMIKRMAKAGSRSGSSFWGCPNYPKCDGTINI